MSVAPYLTMISEVMPVHRRDFTLTDTSILNPNATNPLIDGEWLEIDSSYLAKRGTANPEVLPTFQVFSLRGQYDTQAIGKTTLLYLGQYEAETSVAVVAGLAVGDWLEVNNVSVGGVNKRGLIKAAGAGQHTVVGFVTKVIGTTKVRYVHQGVMQITI